VRQHDRDQHEHAGKGHSALGEICGEAPQFALRCGTREACGALERAASLDPGYTEAHNELGLALGEAGSFEAAEAAFRKALSSTGLLGGAQ